MSQTVVEVISKDGEIVMKTSKLSPKNSEKITFMHRWNVGGTLHSLNDMRLKANVPKGHVNVVFS